MNEQEQEEIQALRTALARLASGLYEATHALRSLSACLKESLATYDDHGAPFGLSSGAMRIWLTYGQFTTPN